MPVTPMFVRSAGALQPWRELRLRSAVGASVAGHALLVAVALAVSALRTEPAPPEPLIRVSLNLGPIRNPAPARPAAPPAVAAAPVPVAAPVAAAPVPAPKPPAAAPARKPFEAPKPAAPPPVKAPAPLAPAPPPKPAPAPKVPSRPAAAAATRAVAARAPVPAPAPETASESAFERALKRVEAQRAGDDALLSGAVAQHRASSATQAPAPRDGGAAGGDGLGPTAADLAARYAALIRAAVEGACQVPAGIPLDEVGDAVVQLRVDSAGRVISFTLARSSGFAALDEVLRSAFARITLPAPPPEIVARAQRGGLRIVFPFAAR